MKSSELNKLLKKEFPYLISKYDEETSWQEGDDTGSHVVYGDVLTPYLVSCIKEDKRDEVKHIFNFLENILNLDDEYTDDVISLSVLESIYSLLQEKELFKNMLGQKSKYIMDKF